MQKRGGEPRNLYGNGWSWVVGVRSRAPPGRALGAGRVARSVERRPGRAWLAAQGGGARSTNGADGRKNTFPALFSL
jgi:hypothetical protein